MYTIHLKNIVLYGRHGVYLQEQQLDAPFLLDISCTIAGNELQNIQDSVDYEKLFFLVKEVFKTPFALLESLANELLVTIKTTYPVVEKVQISVFKTNPAIAGLQGTVGVSLEG
jgi:7,8-dihydroneopterin aldolase/epimerase/oxygenase